MGTVAPSITASGIHVLGSTKEKLAGNILVMVVGVIKGLLVVKL
jgi:hypothetical protein